MQPLATKVGLDRIPPAAEMTEEDAREWGGTAGQRRYVLEGYLAPDTYEIYTSATAEEIVRKLLSQTEAVLIRECVYYAEFFLH